MFPWTHWKTIMPLVLGIFGLCMFIVWSTYVPNEPILRGSMFKAPTALVSYFGTIVHGMFLWSALYYMPLYFEGAKGFSPINAGIGLFPWTFTTGPAAVVVGIVVAKTGRYRWAIWSGWLLTATGIGLMMLFKAQTKTIEWVLLSLVSGLGLGILYPAMSFAIQASASNRDLPFAAALYSFFRNFGQMLGVAVGGAIFQNRVKTNLLTYPDLADRAVEYSKDASALVEVIKKYPASLAAQKQEIITAYVDSLRMVWLIMCVLATLALILAVVFTKGITLERELETDQGFQTELSPVDDLEKMDRRRIRTVVSMYGHVA
jgi:MFS family permease